MICPSRLKAAPVLLVVLYGLSVQATDISEVLIVDLYLNHQRVGDVFVLRDADGEFFVEESVLRQWKINKPWPQPRTFRNQKYYGIYHFSGASAKFEQRKMELKLWMPASLMPLRTVDMRTADVAAPAADFGAYMDYELSILSESRRSMQSTNALFRPVLFGPFGSLNSNFLYRKNADLAMEEFVAPRTGITVLDLTYTRDDPSRLRSLRIGDVITQSGRLGRSLRFGGIQLASNFGTQPTLITYPLPNFYGQSDVPTALDVYGNGQLTRREEVQPGRYVLEDVPVVNGAGQLQVVANDALGRQQVFTQDFYLSTDLLREGLNDYSINVGALREAYGIDNFRYGDMAASATIRHGLRDFLTVEGHGEFGDGVAMLSAGGQYAIKAGGILSGGIGVSGGERGTGARFLVGFQQMMGRYSYNVELTGTSGNFALVGTFDSLPELQFVATGGMSLRDYGSVGVAVVHQGFRNTVDRSIVSANHSITFSNWLSLSTFFAYTKADAGDLTAGIRFSMPFGDHHNTGGGISRSRSETRIDGNVQRNLPVGPGYGYHIAASASNDSFIDAGVIAQSEYGTYSLDVRNSDFAGSGWQLSTLGSVAYLDGMTNFSRQVRDAFAVVNVGNIEGVRVYAENQEIGRTNKNGQIFVPGLRPYIRNQLRVEIDDLPLNTNIESMKLETAPYFRSGVVVDFAIQVSRSVMLRAIMPDGEPVPEGALATVVAVDESFPIGLNGRLYLEGVDASSRVTIRWNGTRCDIKVPDSYSEAVIPDLGDVVCEPSDVQ